MRTLLIATALVVGIVGGLVSPFYALLTYLWFALFRPQEYLWIDITSLRLSLVLGVLLIGQCLRTGLLPRVAHPVSIGVLLFLGLAVGGQAGSIEPDSSWIWLDYLARLVLVALILARLVDQPYKMAWTIAVIGGSFGFHTAKAGVAFLLSGGSRFATGLGGAFSDNNDYALGAALVLPFLIAAAQCTFAFPKPLRWAARLFWLAAPLTALMVIGTFSRGGLLAMLAGGAVLLATHHRRRVLVPAALVVVALMASVVPGSYWSRMETIRTFDEVGESSALSRLHFWNVAVAIAEDHPFGIGLRGFRTMYDRYDTTYGEFGERRSVHSSHFQVLVDTGWLGLLVWIWLFATSFWICIRVRSRAGLLPADSDARRCLLSVSVALMASMASFLVGGAFLEIALNDFTWLTFGLVIALDGLYRQYVDVDRPVDVGEPAPVRPQVRTQVTFAPRKPTTK